jgi:Mrp family chromosome partitioning ATPase
MLINRDIHTAEGAMNSGLSLRSVQGQTGVTHRKLDDALMPCVAQRPPETFDAVGLVRLFHSIEMALPRRTGNIVQFVGCRASSSTALTYQAAWTAATLLGRRVLFIDASQEVNERGPSLEGPPKQLYDVALGKADVEEAINRQQELGLFVTRLYHGPLRTESLLAASQIGLLLEALRTSFDILVIASPPVLEQPLAGVLTAFVDGSVLILQAEQSRGREAKEAVRMLTCGGSIVIGTVLAGRRNYVPRWLLPWIDGAV